MLNIITIMGRLTRDPELRRTGSGVAVANFTVAVDRDYAGPSKEKETDFLDCVAWRQPAEFVSKHFKKGNMIALTGRMEIRKWTDKEGNPRKTAEINVGNVYFAEKKGNSNPSDGRYAMPTAQASSQGIPGEFAMLTDDDAQLPF